MIISDKIDIPWSKCTSKKNIYIYIFLCCCNVYMPRFNITFILTQRGLLWKGSSMLTFIVLPHWSIMLQTLDMIPHPVTLFWHWVDQSWLYPVSLSAKWGTASIILMTLVCRGPGSNSRLPFPRADTLPSYQFDNIFVITVMILTILFWVYPTLLAKADRSWQTV